MALKHPSTLAVVAFSLTACTTPAPPAPAPVEEPPTASVTRWTDKTELFAEYPPLAAGRTSRFAVHLTRLDSFRPVTDGRVEVRLQGGSAPAEVFFVDAPSRPGIFGVDVTPAASGVRELAVVLRAEGLDDEHHVGEVRVYSDATAALTSADQPGGETPGISFLKEQQWSLDFGTALVAERAARESLRVPAELAPRPGGAADIAAPITGRLISVVEAPLGAAVARGQELGRLVPTPGVPGELPQLERARTEAASILDLASRDRERAERLTSAGAAPAKRLDEARAAEEQASARLKAAESTLAQYDAAQTGGAADAQGLFFIRAPIGGVMARRDATVGANVTAGTPLFRIVDASNIAVVGQIPETEAWRTRLITEAEVEIPGVEGWVPAGRLTSLAKVLDPRSRTLPIAFSFDNRLLGVPVGQAVSLHLLMAATPSRPVVPVTAVVDDAGRPIVFVQLDGETFERRAVVLGPRSGDLVQVTDGVRPAERVVTKGAYLLRLASLSTSVPAHGHVH